MDRNIIGHFLPEGLLDYFVISEVKDIGDISTKKMFFEIHLEEINVIPTGYDAAQYESKGFYTEVRIQDFPIRGKAVYLVIKRRRWRHKNNPKDIIRNDYSFVSEGSRFTRELADFLKGTGRYKGGYHQ